MPRAPAQRGRLAADVAGAVAEVRRRGAVRVALVGGSIGASTALVAAAVLKPSPDVVVSLSAPASVNFAPDRVLRPVDAVSRLGAPLLVLGARRDPVVPPSDARAIFAAAASEVKLLRVVFGTAHGASLVLGSSQASLHAVVTGFVRQHTSG